MFCELRLYTCHVGIYIHTGTHIRSAVWVPRPAGRSFFIFLFFTHPLTHFTRESHNCILHYNTIASPAPPGFKQKNMAYDRHPPPSFPTPLPTLVTCYQHRVRPLAREWPSDTKDREETQQADAARANSLATSRTNCLKVLTMISKTNHTVSFSPNGLGEVQRTLENWILRQTWSRLPNH